MSKYDMDLELFIPCDLKEVNKAFLKNIHSEDGEYLINQVKNNNQKEFQSEYVKCLDRFVIGEFKITFKNEDVNMEEIGIFTITLHPRTNLGVINIYISHVKNSPSALLDLFISSDFMVEDKSFKDWAKINNIKLSGTPKALLFSFLPIDEEEIISILACEIKTGQVKGKEFIEMAHNDIAQYKSAVVYCSENVLLELQNEPINNIKERISMEAVETFFMELLLLQDAAISNICNKIVNELELEGKNPLKATNTDILDVLASQLSESILFLDFNNFIYPTARLSAEKIAKNFRLDKQVEKYNTYKDLLESLINTRKGKIEDLENKNMNILLLVLTLTQIIPVLIGLFSHITSGNIVFEDIISFISSIAVCFILILIFNIINRRKKKNYKDKILNLKI